MPDRVRFQDAERLDRPDLEAVGDLPLLFAEQLAAGVLIDESRDDNAVVRGFKLINPSGKNLRAVRGSGIFARREGGTTYRGTFLTEGPDQVTLDLSGYTNGYYSVWIRARFDDAEQENRIFWDAITSAEFANTVVTRRVVNWEMTLTLYPAPHPSPAQPAVSPGSEWSYIGDCQVLTGSIVQTPARSLLFEGDETDGYAPEWGTGNDRNADRDTYGLKSLRTFAQATLKKLGEIQSATDDWWEVVAEPLDQKVSRNGDTMDGDYDVTGLLNADGGIACATPQDIGDSTNPFDAIWGNSLGLKASSGSPTADMRITSAVGQANFYMRADGTPSTEFFQIIYNRAGANFAGILSSDPILFAPSGADINTAATMVMEALQIYPNVDDSVKLGKSGNRWSEMRAVDGFIDNLTATVAADLSPLTNNAFDLGDSTHAYAEAYVTTLFANNLDDISGGAILLKTEFLVNPNTSGSSAHRINLDQGGTIRLGDTGSGGEILVTTGGRIKGSGGPVTVQAPTNKAAAIFVQAVADVNGEPVVEFVPQSSGLSTTFVIDNTTDDAKHSAIKVKVTDGEGGSGYTKYIRLYDGPS